MGKPFYFTSEFSSGGYKGMLFLVIEYNPCICLFVCNTEHMYKAIGEFMKKHVEYIPRLIT